MKYRATTAKKKKIMLIRVTPDEHTHVKVLASERGISITRFVLEAIRNHIRKST